MSRKVTKLDYSGINIYTGIDTHLKNWKITIMTDDLTLNTLSVDPNAHTVGNYLRKHFPNGNYYSAYEAGFCGYNPHRALIKEGIQNIIVNPADIPTTDKERKQKEDSRDSRKIARSLRNSELVPIYVPSQAMEELKNYIRHRKTLVKDINRNKCRIKSFLYLNGITIPPELDSASRYWSSNFSTWLENIRLTTAFGHKIIPNTLGIVNQLRSTLLAVNRELRQIAKREEFAESVRFLISIPGIGLTSALTILSEIVTISRFKNLDQLCSFVGLVPTTNSSSEQERVGNITPRSNKILRSVLIESAWIAIRHDPALRLAYTKLCTRMKSNKAIIRIAKKLLSRIKYVLKNQTEYKCII
jgi:transposase